jgi:hypothetical protein
MIARRAALFIPVLLLSGQPLPDFAKWWPTFQAAVAKPDAGAVAKMAHFPLSWENGALREIATEADFVKNFGTYFTAEIRKAVATGKSERFAGWHVRAHLESSRQRVLALFPAQRLGLRSRRALRRPGVVSPA